MTIRLFQDTVFTPEELIAQVIDHARRQTEDFSNATVKDIVITVSLFSLSVKQIPSNQLLRRSRRFTRKISVRRFSMPPRQQRLGG